MICLNTLPNGTSAIKIVQIHSWLNTKTCIKDHRGHVVKIADFLGHSLSEKAIDLIVEKSTVKEMFPKYKVMDVEDPTWNTDRSFFIRKGKVGDWVNYFSNEQSEYVDEKCRQLLEPLGLTYDYNL